MNKRYSLLGLCAGALTLATSAQRVGLPTATAQPTPTRFTSEAPVNTGARGSEIVVWSEDFSQGFAGNNPSGAWTVDGPNGDIWRINSNGPKGAYTPASERIQSTTYTNGFAKFASDSANCTWNGTTATALPESQFTSWEASLVSPVIDLSLSPWAEVVFQQRSRFCCGTSPFFFEVTCDGGANWTVFESNEGLAINQDPTFTETRRFNIAAAIAANPGSVQFRFHHNSEAGTSHYHWQVDDIQIVVLPEYEVTMNYAYTSTTGTGDEYGRIPATQLPASMNIGAEVANNGSVTQTNLGVECIVRKADGTVAFTHNTQVGDLPGAQTVVSDDQADLPFLDLGKNNATFTITGDEVGQDGNLDDNSKTRHFEVTLDQYSLDALGNHPAGTEVRQQLGTASFADNSTVYLMTMYHILAATQAHSATIVLGTNTRAGAATELEVFLLDTADVLNTQSSSVSFPLFGITSDVVSLTTQQVGAGQVTIPFEQPISLAPGAYYLCARVAGSGTALTTDAEVFIADDNTIPQPSLSSMIYLPVDYNDDGTEGRHIYGNGNALAIRLNVTPAVGIDETATNASIAVYPNPTHGLVNITSDAQGVMNVEVIDLLGATVHQGTFTGRTTLDLSGLARGVYNVRVSNATSTLVERVTLH